MIGRLGGGVLSLQNLEGVPELILEVSDLGKLRRSAATTWDAPLLSALRNSIVAVSLIAATFATNFIGVVQMMVVLIATLLSTSKTFRTLLTL